ncbi:MAG: hypothetical protein O2999_03535 [Nitrospirae bacterium]|nr:hypothetical protein [Nitrospirota bacterium]MDA1303359.1 hypothetical protein [Nitrospirota bacterium]
MVNLLLEIEAGLIVASVVSLLSMPAWLFPGMSHMKEIRCF